MKLAYRHGVDAETLLAMRMLYALPAFAAMAVWAHLQRPAPLRGTDLRDLAVLGFFGYYLSSYADFSGLKYISAGLERVVLYTYPAMVVLMVAAAERRRPSGGTLLALLVSYLGVALAVLHEFRNGSSNPLFGVSLVLISALSMAVYLFRCTAVLRRLGPTRVTAYATGFACLMALAQFALLRPVASLPAQPWQVQLSALAMAVFCTVIPVWLNGMAITRIGASRAAIVATAGPICTLLLAWAFLGEQMTPSMAAGAACVMLGIGLISRSAQRAPREAVAGSPAADAGAPLSRAASPD